MKTILRWILLLPLSLLAAVLVTFFIHWIIYSTLKSFVNPVPEMPEKLLSPLIVGFTIVRVSYFSAPKWNKLIAKIIGLLLIALCIFIIILARAGNEYRGISFNLPYYGIQAAMCPIGVIIALAYNQFDKVENLEKSNDKANF